VVDEELIQLEHLVHSGSYQPNILNLFERLHDYKSRLVAFKTRKSWLQNAISRHESQMGSMEMNTNGTFEQGYCRKQDKLRISVEYNLVQFQQLKLEIVNYTEGLAKKPSGTKEPG
jgi:hypothetical protein